MISTSKTTDKNSNKTYQIVITPNINHTNKMKKLVFLLAVAFSAALYSCGNKAEETATEATDAATDATEVVEAAVEEAVDTVTGDTIVATEVVEAAAE